MAVLFRNRGFTSLPVVADGRLLGVIFRIDLIRRAHQDPFRQHNGLIGALARLIDDRGARRPRAGDIMPTGVPRRMAGIVTRTARVSALAQRLALG